jgi:two-component system, LytTR family, sensor kinase
MIQTAVACGLATVIIGTAMTFINPSQWRGYFLASFVFSYLIGFINRFSYDCFNKQIESNPLFLRILIFAVKSVVSTIIGTELGIFLLDFVPGMSGILHSQIDIIILNLIFVSVVAFVMITYMSLVRSAEKMAEKLKQKDVEREKLLRLKAQAELEALQSKINPHFLFNTLNSIASLISVDPAAAEEMVEKLSALFRYTLRQGSINNVPLEEELGIVRSYLEIEKLRFGSRLSFSISCEENIKNITLPGLLIQPLVENSIKYAIAPNINAGMIEIDAVSTGGNLVITVSDTGTVPAGTESDGFGLKSIRERIALLYGNSARLEFYHDGRTHTKIYIPLS